MSTGQMKSIETMNGVLSFDGESIKFIRHESIAFWNQLLAFGEWEIDVPLSCLQKIWIGETSIPFKPYFELCINADAPPKNGSNIYFWNSSEPQVVEFKDAVLAAKQ